MESSDPLVAKFFLHDDNMHSQARAPTVGAAVERATELLAMSAARNLRGDPAAQAKWATELGFESHDIKDGGLCDSNGNLLQQGRIYTVFQAVNDALPDDAVFLKVLGVGTTADNPHPRIFAESEGGFRITVDQNLHLQSTWVNTGTDRFEDADEGAIVTDNGAADCPSAILRAESEHRWFERHGPRSVDPILNEDFSYVPALARSLAQATSMARQSVAPPEDSPVPTRPPAVSEAHTEAMAIALRDSTARTTAAENESKAANAKVARLETSLRAATVAAARAESSARDQLTALTAEHEEAVTNGNASLRKAESEAAIQMARAGALETTNAELQAKITEFGKAAATQAARVNALEAELNSARAEITHRSHEAQQWRERTEVLEQTALKQAAATPAVFQEMRERSWKAEAALLEERALTAIKDAERLNNEVIAHKSQVHQLEDGVGKAKADAMANAAQAREANAALAATEHTITHLRDEVTKLQAGLAASNRDLSTLRNEQSASRAEIITLQRTVDDANDELRRKSDQCSALDRTCHQLKSIGDKNADELNVLRASHLQAQHKDGKECPGCRTLKTQLSTLRNDHRQLKQAKDTACDELSAAQEAAAADSNRVTNLELEVKRHREQASSERERAAAELLDATTKAQRLQSTTEKFELERKQTVTTQSLLERGKREAEADRDANRSAANETRNNLQLEREAHSRTTRDRDSAIAERDQLKLTAQRAEKDRDEARIAGAKNLADADDRHAAALLQKDKEVTEAQNQVNQAKADAALAITSERDSAARTRRDASDAQRVEVHLRAEITALKTSDAAKDRRIHELEGALPPPNAPAPIPAQAPIPPPTANPPGVDCTQCVTDLQRTRKERSAAEADAADCRAKARQAIFDAEQARHEAADWKSRADVVRGERDDLQRQLSRTATAPRAFGAPATPAGQRAHGVPATAAGSPSRPLNFGTAGPPSAIPGVASIFNTGTPKPKATPVVSLSVAKGASVRGNDHGSFTPLPTSGSPIARFGHMFVDATMGKLIDKAHTIATDFRHAQHHFADCADDEKLTDIIKKAAETISKQRKKVPPLVLTMLMTTAAVRNDLAGRAPASAAALGAMMEVLILSCTAINTFDIAQTEHVRYFPTMPLLFRDAPELDVDKAVTLRSVGSVTPTHLCPDTLSVMALLGFAVKSEDVWPRHVALVGNAGLQASQIGEGKTTKDGDKKIETIMTAYVPPLARNTTATRTKGTECDLPCLNLVSASRVGGGPAPQPPLAPTLNVDKPLSAPGPRAADEEPDLIPAPKVSGSPSSTRGPALAPVPKVNEPPIRAIVRAFRHDQSMKGPDIDGFDAVRQAALLPGSMFVDLDSQPADTKHLLAEWAIGPTPKGSGEGALAAWTDRAADFGLSTEREIFDDVALTPGVQLITNLHTAGPELLAEAAVHGAFVDAQVVTVACQHISNTNLAAGAVVVDTITSSAFTSPHQDAGHIFREAQRRRGDALSTIAVAVFIDSHFFAVAVWPREGRISWFDDLPDLHPAGRRLTLNRMAACARDTFGKSFKISNGNEMHQTAGSHTCAFATINRVAQIATGVTGKLKRSNVHLLDIRGAAAILPHATADELGRGGFPHGPGRKLLFKAKIQAVFEAGKNFAGEDLTARLKSLNHTVAVSKRPDWRRKQILVTVTYLAEDISDDGDPFLAEVASSPGYLSATWRAVRFGADTKANTPNATRTTTAPVAPDAATADQPPGETTGPTPPKPKRRNMRERKPAGGDDRALAAQTAARPVSPAAPQAGAPAPAVKTPATATPKRDPQARQPRPTPQTGPGGFAPAREFLNGAPEVANSFIGAIDGVGAQVPITVIRWGLQPGYRCPICCKGRIFYRSDKLVRHIHQMHGQRPCKTFTVRKCGHKHAEGHCGGYARGPATTHTHNGKMCPRCRLWHKDGPHPCVATGDRGPFAGVEVPPRPLEPSNQSSVGPEGSQGPAAMEKSPTKKFDDAALGRLPLAPTGVANGSPPPRADEAAGLGALASSVSEFDAAPTVSSVSTFPTPGATGNGPTAPVAPPPPPPRPRPKLATTTAAIGPGAPPDFRLGEGQMPPLAQAKRHHLSFLIQADIRAGPTLANEGTSHAHRAAQCRWLQRIGRASLSPLYSHYPEMPATDFVLRVVQWQGRRRRWKWSTTKTTLGTVAGAFRYLPSFIPQATTPWRIGEQPVWTLATRKAATATAACIPSQRPVMTADEAFRCCALAASRGEHSVAGAVALSWVTAGRMGSITQLKRADVAMDEPLTDDLQVTFRRGKTARLRQVAFTTHTAMGRFEPFIRPLLLRTAQNDWLFPCPDNATRVKLRVDTLEYLREATGNDNTAVYSLRRGALQLLANQGAPTSVLLNFSGHADVKTLRGYIEFGKGLRREQGENRQFLTHLVQPNASRSSSTAPAPPSGTNSAAAAPLTPRGSPSTASPSPNLTRKL